MNTICQECKMPVGDGVVYHPHLFCVLWSAYRRDPAEILAEHGYERVAMKSNADA